MKTAETRSYTLEKQLDKMKQLVTDAECDKQDALIQSTALLLEKHTQPTVNTKPAPYVPRFDSQAEKISNLEREQLKLTATQTLAEVGYVHQSSIVIIMESIYYVYQTRSR